MAWDLDRGERYLLLEFIRSLLHWGLEFKYISKTMRPLEPWGKESNIVERTHSLKSYGTPTEDDLKIMKWMRKKFNINDLTECRKLLKDNIKQKKKNVQWKTETKKSIMLQQYKVLMLVLQRKVNKRRGEGFAPLPPAMWSKTCPWILWCSPLKSCNLIPFLRVGWTKWLAFKEQTVMVVTEHNF